MEPGRGKTPNAETVTEDLAWKRTPGRRPRRSRVSGVSSHQMPYFPHSSPPRTIGCKPSRTVHYQSFRDAHHDWISVHPVGTPGRDKVAKSLAVPRARRYVVIRRLGVRIPYSRARPKNDPAKGPTLHARCEGTVSEAALADRLGPRPRDGIYPRAQLQAQAASKRPPYNRQTCQSCCTTLWSRRHPSVPRTA
jgi:hypothetical protein